MANNTQTYRSLKSNCQGCFVPSWIMVPSDISSHWLSYLSFLMNIKQNFVWLTNSSVFRKRLFWSNFLLKSHFHLWVRLRQLVTQAHNRQQLPPHTSFRHLLHSRTQIVVSLTSLRVVLVFHLEQILHMAPLPQVIF